MANINQRSIEPQFRAQVSAAIDAVNVSPTFSGTVTFPDGATWAATGVADAATYTTSSTSMINFAPVWNFSSTANGLNALNFGGTMTPTGASAGNISYFTIAPSLNTSSVNTALYRGLNMGVTIGSGYSGTVASLVGLSLGLTNSGTNPATAATSLLISAFTNGAGITSGTATNIGINVGALTGAAGAAGTVVNTGIKVSVPSSSAAGNADKGIWITGNGGAASTKYALFSDSTAPSVFSGAVGLKVTTVSGLGTATTGYTAFVTDSTLAIGAGLGLAVVGGGGNRVPVYADGTNWIIG